MTLHFPVPRLLPDDIALSAHAFDVDELAEWLDTLPEDRPLELMRALLDELSAQSQAALSQHTRFKLLDLIRDKAEALLPAIDDQLKRSPLPLPAGPQQALVEANELLKQICAGYESVSYKLAHRWYGVGTNRLLCAAIAHGLRLHQRRLRLAYRAYARGSRSAWSDMHRLYRSAREAGVAQLSPDGAGETPERIYIDTLLLAFAEPAKFGVSDLDRVRFYIERHGHLARLEAPSVTSGERSARFLIRPREAGPGLSLAKWRDGDFAPGELILRCDALVQQLETQLAGLEQGTAAPHLGLPKMASQPQYQALLHNLARLWSAPPARRFHRTRFRPRVDVVVGCAALRRFLAGAAYRRRAQDGADPPAQAPMTEWAVTNESADGLALRYLGGDATDIQVGEVLGVRSRGTSLVHVCVVRRAESAVTGLEIGVQVLASHALVASIFLPRDEGGRPRGSVPVMLLPRLPGAADAPALLAPPDQMVPGIEFAAEIEGQHRLIRVARRVEKTVSCELFALEKAEAPPPAGGG